MLWRRLPQSLRPSVFPSSANSLLEFYSFLRVLRVSVVNKVLLDTQCLATLMAVENGLENNSRNKDRREQVGRQAKAEGHSEAAYRAGAEQEQNDGRNDRRHVSVNDRDPGVSKALVHRRRRRLAVPQLLAYALEDQNVGVHAHADRQDDACDSRQGERRPGEAEEAEQDDQVQEQPQVRVDARGTVIEEHEHHDRDHADDRG